MRSSVIDRYPSPLREGRWEKHEHSFRLPLLEDQRILWNRKETDDLINLKPFELESGTARGYEKRGRPKSYGRPPLT